VPGRIGGSFLILAQDASWAPRPQRPPYFGESEDLNKRVCELHAKDSDWKRKAQGQDIYYAYCETLGYTAQQRKDAEWELIHKCDPPCNIQLRPIRRLGSLLGATKRQGVWQLPQNVIDFWHWLWPIAPGICVCLLGAEALGITLIPVKALDERKWIKRTAIVVCFLLAAGEIWMVKLERKAIDEQHKRDMQDIFCQFVKLDQDVLAVHNNAPVTAATRSLPADNLKRQAIDLSNEILSFLISREAPPGYGQGGFGEGPFGGKPADTKDYDAQTMRSYFDAFQIRVDRMHDALKKRGLTDPEFDTEYSNTVNTYSIRTIAERIGELAKKLPG
jgi:hypothetical protein